MAAGSIAVAALAWSPPSVAARMLSLHVAQKGRPAIVDAAGRQVLLRGANSNQLGDYYRVRQDMPPTVRLRRRDLTLMSHMGFDVVRLVISWSRLEPAPGQLNLSYLRRIRRAVDWAESSGVYVVVDMHQDAWGKYVATPEGTTCPPGTVPNQGFDGAPAWATFTDDLSTCREAGGGRSSPPAVGRAWGAFWFDRSGIQERLVQTWGRLARALAGNPAVAGYDLLNEPNPGDARSAGEGAILGTYYGRAIAAIRAGERSRKRGFHHVVFVEPTVLWPRPEAELHTAPPGFTKDTNLVFAPHLYATTAHREPGVTDKDVIRRKFKLAAQQARRYGTTAWVGEWAFFGDAREQKPNIADFARRLDAERWGGTWWQWKKTCGDPANFVNGLDDEPAHGVLGTLNPVACPSGERLPTPPTTRRILSRPYPLAAPGRLLRLRSHPDGASFEIRGLDWRLKGSPWLRIWIPARRDRHPRLGGEHVSQVRFERVVGGWIATAHVAGHYEVNGGYPPPKRHRHRHHR